MVEKGGAKKDKNTKSKEKPQKKQKPDDTICEDEAEPKELMSKEPTHKELKSKETVPKGTGIAAMMKDTKKKILGNMKNTNKSKEKEKDKTSREKKSPSPSLPSGEKTDRENATNDMKILAATKGFCRYLTNMRELSLSTYFDDRLAKYTSPGCTSVEWEKNMQKNRSKVNKLNDNTRVHIDIGGKDSYINASHIKLDPVCSEFILTQYPLKETIHDFWRMVSQKKVNRIITIFEPYVDPAIEEFNKVPSIITPAAVNNSVTGPARTLSQISQTREQIIGTSIRCETNQVKSSFFPLFTDHYMNLDNWLINTRKVEIDERNKNWMSMYTVEIVADECSEANYIRVFNCTTWPWKKVPDEEKKLLALVRAPFKENGPLVTKQEKEPIVVMCDLGLDRSATVVLTTVIIELVLAGKSPDCDALFKKMRDQRPDVFTMSIFYTYAIRAALIYLKMKLKKLMSEPGGEEVSALLTEALNKVPFISNPKKF